MKIYLAASYIRRDEMRDIAARLVHLGHIVVSRWLWINPSSPDDGVTCPDESISRTAAEQDLWDIEVSDIFICFTDGCPSRGGRNCETGYAMALGKRVMIVGQRENIFHFSELVEWYPNLDHLFDTFCVEVLGGMKNPQVIHVTQDDIDKGASTEIGDRCPIALALQRAGKRRVEVGRIFTDIGRKQYQHSRGVRGFVDRFDEGPSYYEEDGLLDAPPIPCDLVLMDGKLMMREEVELGGLFKE